MSPEEEQKELQAVIDPLVQRALSQLGEHCDSVRIFVTKDIPGGKGTIRNSNGCGNWYAQYGQVQLWLQQEQAYHRRIGEKCHDEHGE